LVIALTRPLASRYFWQRHVGGDVVVVEVLREVAVHLGVFLRVAALLHEHQLGGVEGL